MRLEFEAVNGCFRMMIGEQHELLTLSETETLLLKIRDALLVAQAKALNAPRAEPDPIAAAKNAEIDALRRDMQQLARNQQDMAERLKRLEAKRDASAVNFYGATPVAIPQATPNHNLAAAIQPGFEPWP
jgi:hypothetical protein